MTIVAVSGYENKELTSQNFTAVNALLSVLLLINIID